MNDESREVIPGHHSGLLRPVRSSEQGRALVRRRWEKRAHAARQGLRDAAKELTEKAGLTLPDGSPLETEYDVIRALVNAHALQAADPSARSAVQSLNAVDRMAFPAPERGAEPLAGVPAGGMQFNMSAELAREVLAALRTRGSGAETAE